ncbi:alpha/beta hydrolase family protein [Nocardia shimofusensis]|uniref:alpha/beta hydrolase family protein n=1 Tax=Nocardia shimofusensis TaxID=228596 RepID=UPI00082FE9E7|nr:alpha/beta fold hydrolase [Nocardia shimofusensis]
MSTDGCLIARHGCPPATPAGRIGRVLTSVFAALLLVLSAACGSDGEGREQQASPRGEVVSVTPISTMTAAETTEFLADRTLEAPVRNGVEASRVEYRTIDATGQPTTATGLLVLPDTDVGELRIISYAHGTILRKDEAPSVGGANDRARTIAFAAGGTIGVAPDYLGLGEGPGRHPYVHAPTAASASLDLLRAARTLAEERGHTVAPEVYIVGFSQGGQAATALARELHDNPDTGFAVGALSAVSGPYDIREAQTPAAFDGRVSPRAAVVYLAYWITAMNPIYRVYDDPSEAFLPPYADHVEELFDGYHGVFDIAGRLPETPQELLTPRFLEWAIEPTGPALQAMNDSDGTCEWTTDAPVRLYASTADRSVPATNTEECLETLRGERVERIDLTPMDHGATARAAIAETVLWFDRLVTAG